MKTRFTISSLFLFYILFLPFFSFAGIIITFNNQPCGGSYEQGSGFLWKISGISAGATCNNELWYDKNNNGSINPGTDLLFVQFNQTDGMPGFDGPGDDDALANGEINSNAGGISFPPGNYIFKVKSGSDSTFCVFQFTAMASPTFHVYGRVTKEGVGFPDVVVSMKVTDNLEYFGLTNTSGYYTINTNIASGTSVRVRVSDGFNSSLGGYIITPSEYNLVLTADEYNKDFVLSKGKIISGHVTDTTGNPVADMQVNIYPNGGGNGYNGRTDGNGDYFIAVDMGTYNVRFGYQDEPRGYLITYYDQQYKPWNATQITVNSLSPDTIKNINAVLKRGGAIKGTFLNGGVPARGQVLAINIYDNNEMYETWHDNNASNYTLFVPKGTYVIRFWLENIGKEMFYYQRLTPPAIPISINSLADTVRNINVDFSAPPVYYGMVFNGNGSFSNPANWKNYMMPYNNNLATGDTVYIDHAVGGQCNLDEQLMVNSGSVFRIRSGKTLNIPGDMLIYKMYGRQTKKFKMVSTRQYP